MNYTKKLEVMCRAIASKRCVEVDYLTRDGGRRMLHVVPLDIGPSRRAENWQTHPVELFHFWHGTHPVSLLPASIANIRTLQTSFDPEKVVYWDLKKSPWFCARDWGNKS